MFSLCRLCARCIEVTDLSVGISELKTKLEMCCGWKPLENEFEMPQKACTLCVDRLQTSWTFAESVWMAEKQLAKIANGTDHFQKVENTLIVEEIAIEEALKIEPDIAVSLDAEDFGQFFEVAAFDGPIIESETEDSSSNKRARKRKKPTEKPIIKEKANSEPFLTALIDDDRLVGGMISADGVTKLEKLFPEMESMSWNDCQYNCKTCNCIIKSPQNFFAHNRSIHLQKVQSMEFFCFYCNFKHNREFNLNKHIADKHFPHLKYR